MRLFSVSGSLTKTKTNRLRGAGLCQPVGVNVYKLGRD